MSVEQEADETALCILRLLRIGPQTADVLADCAAGDKRISAPRLVWLEKLGMVVSTRGNVFRITPLGVRFLGILP